MKKKMSVLILIIIAVFVACNKPDISTTTAIRLLLDKAANADEVIALLEQYDMHASMNMMVHFAKNCGRIYKR